MTPEKIITINGQEIHMIYCAATENGYESISGNSINAFIPTFGKNEQGEDVIKEPAKATIGDFITLAVAAIVAYYTREGINETPVDSKYILYEATPQERNELLTAIAELRNEWYSVPKTVGETLAKDAKDQNGDNAKN